MFLAFWSEQNLLTIKWILCLHSKPTDNPSNLTCLKNVHIEPVLWSQKQLLFSEYLFMTIRDIIGEETVFIRQISGTEF